MPLEVSPGSPGMQTRRFGGFCFVGVSLSASRKSGPARGTFRALREPASVSDTEQPGGLSACAEGDTPPQRQNRLYGVLGIRTIKEQSRRYGAALCCAVQDLKLESECR